LQVTIPTYCENDKCDKTPSADGAGADTLVAGIQADMVEATSDAAAFAELLEEPEKFNEELMEEVRAIAEEFEVVEYVVVEIEVEVSAPVENFATDEKAGNTDNMIFNLDAGSGRAELALGVLRAVVVVALSA